LKDADSVIYKNNVMFNPATTNYALYNSGSEFGYVESDYNQYFVTDSVDMITTPTSYDWTEWLATGQDANSELFITSTSPFAALGSLNASGYVLNANSSGIDEGVDLSSLFTTDIRDTVRAGTWDVGALERVATDEIVVDGGFDTAGLWEPTQGWSIGSSKATCDGTAGNNYLAQAASGNATIGVSYDYSFEVTIANSGSVYLKIGGELSAAYTTTGVKTGTIVASATDEIVRFQAVAFDGSIDNVSIYLTP